MHFDWKPCSACGSEVRLQAAAPVDSSAVDGPAGPADGVVGTGDPTVDDRICTNADCPTNQTPVGDDPTP